MSQLLNLLMNYLMFAGTMFFAAGATAIGDVSGGASGQSDGGTADSTVGDDASGGEDGDASGDRGDAATDELAAGEQDSGGDGSEETADPDAPVDLGDGRQVPGKWKKAFEAAKTAGVEKEVKQLYFANARLQKVIPGGVNEAIQLARNVEQLGGVEGIQQVQDELQTYHADAEAFERGDPKWIETSFSENPEVSLKHFVNAQNYISEHHPEFFDHLAAKTIIADLDANLDVRAMHAALSKNPETKALADQLAKYYNTRDELQRKAPEKKIDDQTKKISEREQGVQKQEMDVRFKSVNMEVFPRMKSDVANSLKYEAKLAGIDLDKVATEYPGEFRAMLEQIHQELMQTAVKDQRFVDKHYALVQKNDLRRAAEAVNKKHAEIIPDIVRRVKSEFGFFRGKGRPNQNHNQNRQGADQTNSKQAGWERVSKAPPKSDVDWGKTTPRMQLDGQYVLANGKKVQVAY